MVIDDGDETFYYGFNLVISKINNSVWRWIPSTIEIFYAVHKPRFEHYPYYNLVRISDPIKKGDVFICAMNVNECKIKRK